jgi:Fe-S cluster assembly scaffold protein SufB
MVLLSGDHVSNALVAPIEELLLADLRDAGLVTDVDVVVYHQVREDLQKQGVVFMDMDSGLREHEDLVREYWASVIPPNDNKPRTRTGRRRRRGTCARPRGCRDGRTSS